MRTPAPPPARTPAPGSLCLHGGACTQTNGNGCIAPLSARRGAANRPGGQLAARRRGAKLGRDGPPDTQFTVYNTCFRCTNRWSLRHRIYRNAANGMSEAHSESISLPRRSSLIVHPSPTITLHPHASFIAYHHSSPSLIVYRQSSRIVHHASSITRRPPRPTVVHRLLPITRRS